MQLAVIILSLVLFRFLPHPPNFAPFGAFALMAGFYLSRRIALSVPLAALVLSDVALNLAAGCPPFYLGRFFDLAAFALIGWIGTSVRSNPARLAAAASTPFVFFFISNFGVWFTSIGTQMYPKTLMGLLECYAAGLPFLRATIAGDWIYMALLTAVFALASRPSRVSRTHI